MDKIRVANIPVTLFTVDTLNNAIKSAVINCDQKIFLHANAYLVELANTKEDWLIDFFNESDYTICDGAGIQLAARLTNQSIPEKIPYNTWIWELIRFLSANELSIFLLGSDSSTIVKAKNKLLDAEPNLNIKGYHHGYFNKERDHSENLAIINTINKLKPDLLLVGFGMPIQEKWVKENKDNLDAKVILTCGGAFDFISGNKPVAPKAFRKLYLEWLYRFLLEPKRLFRRATVSNWNFIKLLFRNKE